MGAKKVFNLKWWHGPPLSPTMQNLVEIARRTSAWEDGMWCFSLFLFLFLLPAGSAAGSSAGIVFYSRADLGFFRLAGATRCTDQGGIWQGADRSSMPNFTLIGSGVGVYGPQNWKKWNFTNIIAPKGRVPCTIFTKFTSFMRVLSLHNFANFAALFR